MGIAARVARRRRTLVPAVAILAVTAVPVSIAVLHHGFPVTDVDLHSRAVWVTNSAEGQVGRLNRQIDELDGSAQGTGTSDVRQAGDDVFVVDPDAGTLDRVDPAFVEFTERISIPKNARVGYGGGRLSILRPSDGSLWSVDATARLAFDSRRSDPVLRLGEDAQAVVAQDGTIVAVSPKRSRLYTITPEGRSSSIRIPKLTDFELSAVGANAVILDRADRLLIRSDGSAVALGADGVRIQQPGPDADSALVAARDGLVRVPLDGGQASRIGPRISGATDSVARIAAPVRVGTCDHAAWSGADRYVFACDEQTARSFDLPEADADARLEFRVNRDVVALNDLTSGDVWLASDRVRLVDNWSDVIPPKATEAPDGTQKSATESYSDTLAKRSAENRPPTAKDDRLGVRPGTTTILPVLSNDTDPDGDVLVIDQIGDGWQGAGKLDAIDGGRSLQFTPSAGATGGFSFRYGVEDGRGGTSSALVTVAIVPREVNSAPVQQREARLTVGEGQSVTYNVLVDFLDPEGDDLFLVSASARGGDAVRVSADGRITFRSTAGTIGEKTVDVVVSDGRATASGGLVVEVEPSGDRPPVAVPDFLPAFTATSTTLSPLENDTSPSGQPLRLLSVEVQSPGIRASANPDRGTLVVTAPQAGSYYLQYTVGAGSATSNGLVRVQVADPPGQDPPPVAVKDVLYLRGSETGFLRPLDNDVSPTGRVLGIQTVDVPVSSGLHVEVLSNTELRVTTEKALSGAVSFRYTVSDGSGSATAAVSVVPVPPLASHQAPIAVDDSVTVRAGDIAAVRVLANDEHPDGIPFRLDPALVQAPASGLAFVSGDTLRVQAPDTAGTLTAVYRITDDYGQQATATVTITVLAATAKGNRAPVPQPITSRVFVGGHVTIEVPLDGIEPDGDSVQLDGFPKPATHGDVSASATAFTYTAYPDRPGTDSFIYRVADSYGKTATGTVRIGVIPRAEHPLSPVAVDDEIAIRPGRTGSVDVLANDSDPNGYAISVAKKLTVPDGATAVVDHNRVLITAPDEAGSLVVGYTLVNGHGGVATATIAVTVTPRAPDLSPTAIDHLVKPEDVAGRSSIDVDAREGGGNPSGRLADLDVAVTGPNADAGDVQADGRVRVRPAERRTAIAYTLTDPVTRLSATAFIVVPPRESGPRAQPPIIKPGLPEQVVPVDQTRTWKLSDIVYAPSGRPTMITAARTVSATRSNGANPFVDDTTLRFTPEKGYRGPASITFQVTDGSSADDPDGNVATLTLPLTVGDPDALDQPPTFTGPTLELEAGGSLDFDLRQATGHPNPRVIQDTRYSDLDGSTDAVRASLSGSTLHAESPRTARVGSTVKLTLTARYRDFVVPGTVTIRVVSSKAPLPRPVDDHDFAARARSTTVDVLANDENPFPDTPLRVVDVRVENPTTGARATTDGRRVTVTAGTSFVGDAVVVYTVQDATDDTTRRVTGRLTVTVWDRPDAPAAPVIVSSGDSTVSIRFAPPAQTNGTTITGSSVRSTPASSTPSCTAGPVCTFTGLQNGTAYTFSVIAHARVEGSSITTDSPESAQSDARKPFARPEPPSSATTAASGYAPATVSLTWGATPSTGGGSVRYGWEITRAGTVVGSGETGGQSASVAGQPRGVYSGRVRACNEGADGRWSANDANCSDWRIASAVAVQDAPPPPTFDSTDTANKGTCGAESGRWYQKPYVADPCDTGVSVAAGTRAIFQCRGQRDGVQWGFVNLENIGTYFVRLADLTMVNGQPRTIANSPAC